MVPEWYDRCETEIDDNAHLLTAAKVENYPQFSYYDMLTDNNDYVDTWEKLYTFEMDPLKEMMYDLYMVRYNNWSYQCSEDGYNPTDAKNVIDKADSIYFSAEWYLSLLWLQFLLIIVAILINYFRKEKACKRKTHRICTSVRFALSAAAAVLILMCLSTIKRKLDDEDIIYLTTNSCTDDDSLQYTLTHIKDYLDNTEWRWIVSLVFLIVIFTLDLFQVIFYIVLSKGKKKEKKHKKDSSSSTSSSSASDSDDNNYRKQ